MATIIETGHARNAAHFVRLLAFCNGWGNRYAPARPNLTLPALQTLQQNAEAALQTVKTTKAAFDQSGAERKKVFSGLKGLSTRVANAYSILSDNAAFIGSIRAVNRKIQGGKSTPAPAENAKTTDGAVVKGISSSQQSYDNLADHFAKLIAAAAAEPAYTPNEQDLTLDALNTMLSRLQAANAAVVNTYAAWSNARRMRDEVFYNPLSGLVQTASDVKKYVKSLFGAASPEYRQVSGLEFRVSKQL